MESENKKKSTFSAVSINRITAERFRVYSKTVSKSHSETIDTIIDFFEKTKITPRNEVMISFIKFQNYMIGRFDYIEVLLRTMEREQIKPTHEILKNLFEGNSLKENKQPLLIEKGLEKLTREEWYREEGTVSFDKYHKLIQAKGNDLRKFREVLSKIEKVDPTFGKSYFKIEIDEAELEALKRELNEK
ncbi:hypothetical protein HPE56_20170 [Maribacter sp. ANRC-HE7]|uniref:Uncharacterized protein n=1 Tax=Maribacter aquimaris TaxID=2737171 RepID=A0ABR7V8Z7_9FLAO|nr:BfmA/BtgA family mobilization protein [Maribacter aquimaris]MBD0780121.1 hypothetical protein [Maribacter aquimaris]